VIPLVTPSEALRVEFKDHDLTAVSPSLFPVFTGPRSSNDIDRLVSLLVGFVGVVVLSTIFFLLFKAETKQVNKIIPDSFVNANASPEERQEHTKIQTALDEGISTEDQLQTMDQKLDTLHSRKMEAGGVKTAQAPIKLQVTKQF
jgi:hypothetical protein